MFLLGSSWRRPDLHRKNLNVLGEFISRLYNDRLPRELEFGLRCCVKNNGNIISFQRKPLVETNMGQGHSIAIPLNKISGSVALCCRLLSCNSKFPYSLTECKIPFSVRKYCSALFITNDKLSQVCSNVVPTFDIAQVLQDKENILNDMKRRNINTDQYDFTQMGKLYEEYVSTNKIISELEFKLVEVEDYLMRNKTKLSSSEIEKKIQEKRNIKTQLKQYDNFLLEFQKNVVIKVLSLPNVLDDKTPTTYEIIEEIHPSKTKTKQNPIDLMERLRRNVRFSNKLDINYLGSAAKFEYLFPIVLKSYFITQNFIQFTNTDLCKSVIVEGCGTPYLCPYENVMLENNEVDKGDLGYNERRSHLVGSAHMSMFCAYHTNHSVNVKDLPLKYVASGKRYGFSSQLPEFSPKDFEQLSVEHLYNSVQKETVSLFVGVDSHEKLLSEIEQLDITFKSFLRKLNVRHRVCVVPASCLHASEMRRIEYQVFSDSLSSWVTCVNICVNGDYISKRLSMCHHKSVTSYQKQFLHILNANVFVTVLLVNLIEQGEEIKVEKWRDCLLSETQTVVA